MEWKHEETTLNSTKKYINENQILAENQLFDEVPYLKCYLTTEKINNWNEEKIKPDIKHVIFQHFENNIPCSTFKQLV